MADSPHQMQSGQMAPDSPQDMQRMPAMSSDGPVAECAQAVRQSMSGRPTSAPGSRTN